jgi:hypothetical protein
MENIQEEIQLIHDSDSLAVFLKSLGQDFLVDKESWENWSLDQYIASVSGWVEDGGFDMVIKDKPLQKNASKY